MQKVIDFIIHGKAHLRQLFFDIKIRINNFISLM